MESELADAKRRIRDLEAELTAAKLEAYTVKDGRSRPKETFRSREPLPGRPSVPGAVFFVSRIVDVGVRTTGK